MRNLDSALLLLSLVGACSGGRAPASVHDGTSGQSGEATDAGKGGETGSSGARAPGAAGGGGGGGGGGAGWPAAGSGGAGRPAAGSGGAAGTSGAPSSASRCPNPELLLCDGFESGSIDGKVWHTKQAAPSVDKTHAARGSTALHMHTSATGVEGIETSAIFVNASGHYYGRLFVYFDALPTSPQWAHWTIVGANPKQGTGENRVGGQYDGKINRWGVGTDQGPSGDWTNLDGDPSGAVQSVPLKQWLCVEWLHDWANDVTRFYLDGVEHPSLDTTADVKHAANSSVKYELSELGSVWVGFWNYNQSKPVTPDMFDVWIDEVAIDDERIGCDR